MTRGLSLLGRKTSLPKWTGEQPPLCHLCWEQQETNQGPRPRPAFLRLDWDVGIVTAVLGRGISSSPGLHLGEEEFIA